MTNWRYIPLGICTLAGAQATPRMTASRQGEAWRISVPALVIRREEWPGNEPDPADVAEGLGRLWMATQASSTSTADVWMMGQPGPYTAPWLGGT